MASTPKTNSRTITAAPAHHIQAGIPPFFAPSEIAEDGSTFVLAGGSGAYESRFTQNLGRVNFSYR
jgi:hypothetical protein